MPISELRWRPSVYGIVIKDNCLLVSPQFHGYDLPGGGVELGESLEEALLREVNEETGISVSSPRLLTGTGSFFKLPVSSKGLYVQSILLYYACDYKRGELSMDGFTEDEKKYSRKPEWLPLAQLDNIELASSVGWRPIVKQAAAG